MWKKLRYLSYGLVFLSLIVIIYNSRDFYLVPLIQTQVNKLTGNKLQFRSFAISLPFKFSLYDLNYDNKILLDSVDLELKPLKLIKTPLKTISSITIDKAKIIIRSNESNSNNNQKPFDISKFDKFLKKLKTEIFINETNFIYHNQQIKLKNTHVGLDKNIAFTSSAEYKSHAFEVDGKISVENNSIKPDFNVTVAGQLKSTFVLKGTYNFSDRHFDFEVNAGNLSLNRFDFGKSSFILKNNQDGFNVASQGDFGYFNFNAPKLNFDIFNSSGTINLKDKENIISSQLDYVSTMDKGILNLSVFAKNIKLFETNLGTLTVVANNNNEQLNLDCKHDIGSNIKAVIKKDGDYEINISNKKPVGYFSGNYKYGTVSVNIKKLALSKLSVMKAYDKTITGFISLYGDITKETGSVNINIENINSKRIRNLSGTGKLSKQDYQWLFDFITKDKKLFFQGIYKDKQNYKIDTNYDNIDITTILKVLNIKAPVTGFASGYIKYNSNFDFPTQINMHVKNGSLYDNKFNTCDIIGELSSKTIQISTFTLSGQNVKFSLKSLFDFNNNNTASYLYCDIENFKIDSVNINSKLYFEGKIKQSNEISGQLIIPKAKLNNFDLGGLTSDIILSRKKIEIKNLDNKNGLSGNLSYDFNTRQHEALIQILKADITKHYKKLKGILSSEFILKGSVKNPYMKISYNLKNGYFSSIDFTSAGDFEYKNKSGNLNKFTINSNKSSITGSGKINPQDVSVNLKINNITEKTINNYVNFRTPVTGTFKGTGKIYGSLQNLKCLLKLTGDTVYFKKVKLNDFKSNILLTKNEILLQESSVKLGDSQLNLTGSFDTKNNLYSFIFNFVNTHLGPFDLFGNLKLYGAMKINKGIAVYTGNIELYNLWVNREKIDSLKFDYTIANKKINLKTSKDTPLQISGGVDFTKYPKLQFDKILLCHNEQSCYIDGASTSDNLNVAMTWKSLDGLLISHLFNLPVELDGNIDIKLKAAGNISSPNVSCVLNSKNGNIENVNYDSLDIDVNIKNNILNINKAQIQRGSAYTANVTGFFPLWFDPGMKKDMLNKKVKIDYELKDNKLAILSNFTKDTMKIKKGNLQITGSVSGTRKHITHTAKLQLSGSNITTNSYISKIKDLQVNAVLENNIFSIQNFDANIGSGRLTMEGDIHFVGTTPSFYNLSLFTSKKGIPIIIRDLPIPASGVLKIEKNQTFANYSKGTPKFNFKLYGPANDIKLTGWAELENTKFSYPPPAGFTSDDSLDLSMFENCYINIDLKSALNTQFENAFASVFLKGTINLKGKLDAIKASGVVESDNGKIFYMGNDLNVIYSKLEIINDEIFISGEADTDVYTTGESMPDVIKVYVERSSVNNLKIRFVSKNDPTLESNKVLSRLTKTDPTQRQILDTNTDYLVKQQAVRMFSSNIATPLANSVLKKTGIIDNVRLGYVNTDNLQVASGNEPTIAEILYGMKYSVEKNINRNLQLGYSVTFDQLNREIDLKHALEMSVRLNPFLFLRGSYGLRSEDPQYKPENRIMLEQKFRFGGSSK